MNHIYVVIMAGGEGTRFYPLSTPERPKQFLNFIGDNSFLRQTFERVASLVSPDNVYVSTNDRYLSLVAEQVPEVPVQNIVGEPFKKNTAPALAYCAAQIHAKDPHAIMICLPSDHYIRDENKFREILSRACAIARDGFLVTLGMKPTWASTDYGYICPSTCGSESVVSHESKNSVQCFSVKQFTEKPKLELAKKYINEGYLWNGGIFIWQTETFLNEIKLHSPDLLNNARSLTPYTYFESVRSISIDYAVMERSKRVAVIPTDIGWSDVGGWESVARLNEDGVKISDSVSEVMFGNEKCPWRRIVSKPWGHEEIWAHTPKYVGKTLFIKKGNRLSLQYHKIKEETLRLLSGELVLELSEGKKRTMFSGDVEHIPPGAHHRMEAKKDCVVLEVSTPELDDIVRLSDDYGR